MYLLIVILSSVSFVNGVVPFTWKDCSPDPNTQAVKILSIAASPVPLIAPGPLHLSFSAKILKSISNFVLEFDMKKHAVFGSRVPVPCLNGIGSCTNDGCSFVKSLLDSDRISAQSIAKQAVQMIESVNATVTCPIPVEDINVQDYTIDVPDIGAIASVIADGDYTVTVSTKVPATGEVLGCLSMEMSIKRKCTGFLCGFGRK